MNKITLPVLALVLLTIPQLLDAQQRGRGDRGGRGGFMRQQNPIQAFLQADDLGLNLTDDQTSQLNVLRAKLDETNAPSREALAALVEQASGGFDQSLREQMQPHRQAMQESNEAALQAVRAEVLTDEQWTAVRTYLETIQPQRRGGGRRGGRGGR